MKILLLLILCCTPFILIQAQTDKASADCLQSIKENFRQTNSITTWSKIVQIDDFEETAEGGKVQYYYMGKDLKKIIATYFGETGKYITEYYILNRKLSFVFEQDYEYNRPIYWDDKHMRENTDSEVFDIKKSKISEIRSYFENEKLIYQISTDPKGTDENKILDDFKKHIVSLTKERSISE